MKNYTKLFAPFALAFLIGSMTFMLAQTKNGTGEREAKGGRGGFPERDFGPGGLHPRLLEQLNLTDTQKTQISALQESARTASQALFEQLQTIHEQIRTATQNGAFNETQVRALLSTKANLQVEQEIIRLRADAAIYALLTAEQRTLLETLRQQRPEHPLGDRPGGPRS